MSSAARSRLAAQAAAAGYPPELLALIAHATLPRYRAGQQLEDAQIEQVTDAVDVLAQAGYSGADFPAQLADHQRRHGEDWRQRFWASALAIASVRYRHPNRNGRSPCESDPDRLTQHASDQSARSPAPARAA